MAGPVVLEGAGVAGPPIAEDDAVPAVDVTGASGVLGGGGTDSTTDAGAEELTGRAVGVVGASGGSDVMSVRPVTDASDADIRAGAWP